MRGRFTIKLGLAACLTFEKLTAIQLTKMRQTSEKQRNVENPAAAEAAAK